MNSKSPHGSAAAWLSTAAVVIATLLLYSINLGQLPHPDELYHLLAAEGLLATGEPAIGADGRYWRGYPFTWLVAQSIDLFGSSLAVGRLPAILFMALLCGALFLFLHREAGPRAAWLGAGLFALSPFVIDLARFIRFYSLQCLLFFVAAWIIYALAKQPERLSWRALPAAVVALGLLGFAVYLQPSTLFGIGGLGVWLTGIGTTLILSSPRLTPRHKQLLVAAALSLGLLALLALWASGLLDRLLADYRHVALFNEANADRFWFYFVWIAIYYPLLVLLSGFIVLYAYAFRPHLTIFLLTIFLVGFLLNSFAASKSLRYLAYAQPFLFALWGVGLAALLADGSDMLRRLHGRLADRLRSSTPRHAAGLARALLVAAALFAIAGNPAWLRSLALITGITLPMQVAPTDWAMARTDLQPLLERVDVFVTTEELGPLFYYDRADILLSASKYAELPAGRRAPFGHDIRTDVPTIATAASLALVIDCHSSGLFLTQLKHWGEGAVLRDPQVETLLLEHAERLALPAESQLLAFVWQHDDAPGSPEDCAVVPTVRD